MAMYKKETLTTFIYYSGYGLCICEEVSTIEGTDKRGRMSRQQKNKTVKYLFMQTSGQPQAKHDTVRK